MAEVDRKLLEMAEVFHMPKSAVNEYIIFPAKFPGLAQKKREKKRREYEKLGKIIAR